MTEHTSINIAIDRELLDKIRQAADDNERTISGQIRWYCKQGVANG